MLDSCEVVPSGYFCPLFRTQNDPRKIAEYLIAALKKLKREKDAQGLKSILIRKLDVFVDDSKSPPVEGFFRMDD